MRPSNRDTFAKETSRAHISDKAPTSAGYGFGDVQLYKAPDIEPKNMSKHGRVKVPGMDFGGDEARLFSGWHGGDLTALRRFTNISISHQFQQHSDQAKLPFRVTPRGLGLPASSFSHS